MNARGRLALTYLHFILVTLLEVAQLLWLCKNRKTTSALLSGQNFQNSNTKPSTLRVGPLYNFYFDAPHREVLYSSS